MNSAVPGPDSPLQPQACRQVRRKVRPEAGHEGEREVWFGNSHQTAPAYPQLVPDDEFSPPFVHELPNLLRRESAEMLDLHLQHLASHETRCRLTLGRLAQVLLGHRVYRELGFVRVGDYTRERLGLSARQLQSLAQVTESLQGHPELLRLFEAGEISWTELRKRVSAVGNGAGTGTSTDADTEAGAELDVDDGNDLIEGEPAVEFCLPCPPPVRLLWRHGVELASRASGSALAYWQAAEVIAAEAPTGFGDGGAQPKLTVGLGAWPVAGFETAFGFALAPGSAAALAARPTTACRDPKVGLRDEVLLSEIPPLSFFPDVSLPADVVQLTEGLATVTAHEFDADSDETADTGGSESPGSVHFGAAGAEDSDGSESADMVHFGARCCGGGSGLSFSSVNIRFFGPVTSHSASHRGRTWISLRINS